MLAVRSNLAYLLRQSVAALVHASVLCRALALVAPLGFLLSFWPAAVRSLSVTSGFLLPPHLWLWTPLTHWLVEPHAGQAVLSGLALLASCKLLEPLWGGRELLAFFLLVNVSVAGLAGALCLLLYAFTALPDLLFTVRVHGLAGYVGASTVAVKQLMPDHVLTRRPVTLTYRNVPLLLVSAYLLLHLIGVVEAMYVLQLSLGVLVSWSYLRFYQPHSNGTRGDMASSFAFAQFFPTVLQPLVSVLFDAVYACLVALRCCRQPVKKYDVGAPSSITISLPGVDAHDAERRRQKALKALNDRLQKVEPTPAWPTLEEDQPSTSLLDTSPVSPPLSAPLSPSLPGTHGDTSAAVTPPAAKHQQPPLEAVHPSEEGDMSSSTPSSVEIV